MNKGRKVAIPMRIFAITMSFIFLSTQICFAQMGKNPIKPLEEEKTQAIDNFQIVSAGNPEDYESTSEYKIWKKELDSCKKTKTLSTVIAVIGAGVSIAGAIITANQAQKAEDEGEGGVFVNWLMIGVGLPLLGGGLYYRFDAEAKESRLKREGKSKGYISLNYNPAQSALGIALNFEF